jgi:hypothetical protein
MHWSELDGVYFVEGRPGGAQAIRPITSELLGAFSSSQLKTLDHVKRGMAIEVLHAGGNAVVDFKYGQRSSFWKSLFSVDDVFWHGSGTIAKISPTALPKRK